MSDNQDKAPPPEASPEAENNDDQPAAGEVGATGETPCAAAARDLEAEVATLTDQLLRALAEAENVRRRGDREREELRKFAITGFARDVIDVFDNLGRALDTLAQPGAHTDAQAGASADTLADSLSEGVRVTHRALEAAIERHGITRIDPLGQPFDHNFHEAMFEMPHDEQPPGTVVQVVQPGYALHGRLLRPAKVGVAKRADTAPRVDTEA